MLFDGTLLDSSECYLHYYCEFWHFLNVVFFGHSTKLISHKFKIFKINYSVAQAARKLQYSSQLVRATTRNHTVL